MQKYNYSILFVEDDIAIRENYVTALKMSYNNVYEAFDGHEAYEIYSREHPDIIISDINMPLVNGIDLVKKIRKIDNEVKIIMLTAYTDTETLLQAVELRLSTYLVKPVSSKDLTEALLKVMRKIESEKHILILKNGYIWDFYAQELLHNESKVKLTKKERSVLHAIFRYKKNTTAPYYVIQEEVWGEENELILARLKTVVKNIRLKTFEEIIINNYGEGYCFSC